MLFDEIQSKIWGLSASAGTSPFTFLSFKTEGELRLSLPADYLNGYTQGIAFFLWEDYTVEHYADYLTLSKQYLMIKDSQKREDFLIVQAAKMAEDKDGFLQWQLNQIYIALGFAISEIRSVGLKYKEVEYNHISCFKPSLEVTGAVLSEILLF